MTTITTNPPAGQILIGDALERLRKLATASADTIVTSPPYFRLRDYQTQGQIGLEDTVADWVTALRGVMREAARVLKPVGTLWLNLGDTYARAKREGGEPKSFVLAPEKMLLGLEADGWSLRNRVVWHKPNGLPTSVRDRLACHWEPIYLLTRSRRYFFDLDAIRIPATSTLTKPATVSTPNKYRSVSRKRPAWAGPGAGINNGLDDMKARGLTAHPLGKNPGDVWSVPTAAYRGAHFATFPPRLIERPIRAGCPERVCRTCGTAWRRAQAAPDIGAVAVLGTLRKSCACDDRSWEPGLVLDPFFGSGTVGLVAEQLGRRWIGIEINAGYARQAHERIEAARSAA